MPGGPEPGSDPEWFEGTESDPNYANDYGIWDRGTTCQTLLPSGTKIFHDGCSGDLLRNPPPFSAGPNAGTDYEKYGQVFHDACVLHDHCYHHNPSTYGFTVQYCDRYLWDQMKEMCDKNYASGEGRSNCYLAADEMAGGVKIVSIVPIVSNFFYDAFDYSAPYFQVLPPPANLPLRCRVGYSKQSGQKNYRILCRAILDPNIQYHNCSGPQWTVNGVEYCQMNQWYFWYNVKTLILDKCPGTYPLLRGRIGKKPVCQALVSFKIASRKCSNTWNGYCIWDMGYYYKARKLK